MAVTRDGGCIFAGVSRSSNGNLTSNYGLGDYWVGKVDAGGNLEWQRNYGGTGNDFAHAVEQTGDGGYLVSGYARSADVDVHYNNGQEDMWILRLDETGTILWQKSFGGTGGEGAGALRITNDGGCVLAGTTHSFNIDVIGNHGYEHDFWVVKIDSLGKKEWARCLGGDDTDNGNEIIVTEDGGYLVVGRGESYNGDATSNKGNSDFWAVKLNASGAIQWQFSFGGTSYDEAYAVLETAGGHFVVGGFSSSGDYDVTVNRGGSDFWVAEVVPPSTSRFYADEDGDGYGNSSVLIEACSAPAGFVSNSSDCNDANAMQHPEQEDICNGIDDDCNGFIDENGIQASITPLSTLTICNTSILTYSANVGVGLTYQWMIDGLPITGATAATYDANTAGMYSVAVSDGTCSATSAGSILKTTARTVDLLPSGTSTVCPGFSQNFKFTSNPGLTFQWYKSGIALPGITGSNYSTSDTGSYYVRISDIVGCSFNSSTSTLQNYAAPVTTLKVTGNLNICSTGSVKFTVTAQSGSTYKWYKDNQVISGATKNTYTATSAGSYKALVTTSNGCSKYTAIKSVTGCRLQREIIGEEVETVLGVFPNPSNGTFTLKVESMHAPSGAARFYAFNAAGQMVLTQEVWLTDGRLEERITLPESTKPGLYFLRLITSEAEATSTIVITE
jgi:hypothetical protein